MRRVLWCDCARLAEARPAAPAPLDGAAPGCLSARTGEAPVGLEEALGAHGIPAAQILLAAGDVADRTAYVNARQAFAELFRSARCRS